MFQFSIFTEEDGTTIKIEFEIRKDAKIYSTL